MKLREVNERADCRVWVPDSIADWDAPSHWERSRFNSMEHHLHPGMTVFDVGTEHGWVTAVWARWCGPENVVLFEPSPPFWRNIRMTWEYNEFPNPRAVFAGFVGDESSPVEQWADKLHDRNYDTTWPSFAYPDEECPAMEYRYLHDGTDVIPAVTIDDFVATTGIIPDAITVDIEGYEVAFAVGAATTLSVHRPLVWISVHPDLMKRDCGTTPEMLHLAMQSYDYHSLRLGIDHEIHMLYYPSERKLR